MKLLCWMVLAILVVESLQKLGKAEKATSVSAIEQQEGSGGSSESSEENTEAVPANNEKEVIKLILPDESAPPSSNETDSDETIKRALNSIKSKNSENPTHAESSDLVVLGESGDDSAVHNSHGKEESPNSEEPSSVRSSLLDGKLRPEINDRNEVSPTPGDPRTEKHSQPHEESPSSDGKGGGVIDEGKLSDVVRGGSDEQIVDGKSGNVVRVSDSVVPSSEVAASTTPSADPTTTEPTGHPEKIISAVHEETSSSFVAEVSSPSFPASSEFRTEASSTLSDGTTVSPSSPTDASVETSSSRMREPKMSIYDFNYKVFQADTIAVYDSPQARGENRSELQCVGPYCDTPISAVTCQPIANLTSDNKTSSIRYAIPIQWTCGSSDFEPEFRITKSTVVCEGYDYPGDHWIVKGSCVLIFQLDRLQSSPYTSKDDSGQSKGVVAIILTMLVLTGMGYFVIKAVILKSRHGHWVPSYCALPLKARMGIGRKRQADFDDEPVDVHFDMGEEQTNIGRTRIRSYGSK